MVTTWRWVYHNLYIYIYWSNKNMFVKICKHIPSKHTSWAHASNTSTMNILYCKRFQRQGKPKIHPTVWVESWWVKIPMPHSSLQHVLFASPNGGWRDMTMVYWYTLVISIGFPIKTSIIYTIATFDYQMELFKRHDTHTWKTDSWTRGWFNSVKWFRWTSCKSFETQDDSIILAYI